jgi:hypothetical protein
MGQNALLSPLYWKPESIRGWQQEASMKARLTYSRQVLAHVSACFRCEKSSPRSIIRWCYFCTRQGFLLATTVQPASQAVLSNKLYHCFAWMRRESHVHSRQVRNDDIKTSHQMHAGFCPPRKVRASMRSLFPKETGSQHEVCLMYNKTGRELKSISA